MRWAHETIFSQIGGPHTCGTHLLIRGRSHAPGIWEIFPIIYKPSMLYVDVCSVLLLLIYLIQIHVWRFLSSFVNDHMSNDIFWGPPACEKLISCAWCIRKFSIIHKPSMLYVDLCSVLLLLIYLIQIHVWRSLSFSFFFFDKLQFLFKQKKQRDLSSFVNDHMFNDIFWGPPTCERRFHMLDAWEIFPIIYKPSMLYVDLYSVLLLLICLIQIHAWRFLSSFVNDHMSNGIFSFYKIWLIVLLLMES